MFLPLHPELQIGCPHSRTDAFCDYQPRPSKDGPFRWIRQEFFENEYVRYTDPQGIIESWEYFMAPINVRFETGDRFEFNWNPHGEILLAPFAIAPGVVILQAVICVVG